MHTYRHLDNFTKFQVNADTGLPQQLLLQWMNSKHRYKRQKLQKRRWKRSRI